MATRKCIYCNTKFSTAQSQDTMSVECYICFLNRVNEVQTCVCHYPAVSCKAGV